MKNYSIDDLKARFATLGYQWLTFHLIGVRSAADVPDSFDDLLILVCPEGVFYFSATTNPGVYWLENFMNPNGTAVLVPGQYIDGWKPGLHKGLPAFVQNTKVKVYRDKDKDLKSEKASLIQEGFFGINIHRASNTIVSKVVGKWSAGCQVFNGARNLEFVLAKHKLAGLPTLTYTLLEEF